MTIVPILLTDRDGNPVYLDAADIIVVVTADPYTNVWLRSLEEPIECSETPNLIHLQIKLRL